LTEAKHHLNVGEFPPGSMGPKMESAIQFLDEGGEEVLITSVEKANEARMGQTGTRIVHG
jgi:carbamate kinase